MRRTMFHLLPIRTSAACALLLALGCGADDVHARADNPGTAGPVLAGPEYRQPGADVIALLTAPPPPESLLHARSGQVALLFREPVISLDRLARQRLGLAGFRFDPVTRTSGVGPLLTRVEVVSAAAPGGEPTVWQPADGTLLDHVRFAPDGRHLSALAIVADGPARLAVFDIASGRARTLSTPVNAAWGEPCRWISPDALLCRLTPADLGPAPPTQIVPTTVEHTGAPTPTRTYANLLENDHDDALFEHWFDVEIARVSLDGRAERVPGMRGLFASVAPSPDGAFAVVDRLVRPYPRLVPARRFPSAIEVWDLARGERRHTSRVAGFGVEQDEDESFDPRDFAWKPGTPTTLGWIARDTGPDGSPLPDRWMALSVTDLATPVEIARSDRPIRQFGWTAGGTPFFSNRSEDRASVRVYAVFEDGPQLVFERSAADRAGEAGRVLSVNGSDGPVLELDGSIFLAGEGQGRDGPQPFLDALQLRSRKSERLFTAERGVFEQVLGVLGTNPPVWVTSRESESAPPNLYVVRNGKHAALRPFATPYPQLANVTRRLLTYQRADGVALSATLYLPAGYREGTRLPTLVWIYPREFSEREQAELLDVRSFRFHRVRGPSPLAAVLEGYAVLLNPTVPILHEQGAVNDDYLPQLVASTEAAVDHVVAIGVTDPARVAVGGRSYGAFSSANLLVHSQRFATAIAMSGAYNRTLTPFGFQRERRSFWEATELYTSISPFFFADRIRQPLLLVHGAADENAGTPAMQTRRFFHALAGAGATARYVELPYEGHNYWARESVLHATAEMLDWLDRTIGKRRD